MSLRSPGREPGLELRYSHKLKGGRGIVFGTDPRTCDIVLPALQNREGRPLVSKQHFYITFDAQRRLVLRDCSTHGTTVTYDGRGSASRSNSEWVIGGDIVADSSNQIVIEIHPTLKFQIVVSRIR
ncbi:hypothetical protein EJ05DRAFT_476763 [Pseudovirgaria hyperparasitica]|uniref:FHA domain-containing protein n=1 Tax=Pseudovirgaria hyperparasitica TaxID=470096 RepID=A0A6A6W3T1_9PEZI|nr:uncharacterized protein EJ05DRAFT_476763 [Pseudovirgaria hyperparasitica]KAF2757512.1 hypothetical protein EJ05DRAFT_476763 [Pseudovirgaria hyperparasitica]